MVQQKLGVLTSQRSVCSVNMPFGRDDEVRGKSLFEFKGYKASKVCKNSPLKLVAKAEGH